MIPAVVLCGGKGTRIAPALPPGLPKCLADVGGEPFLLRLLDQLAPYCDPIVLAVGCGANAVAKVAESWTGDGTLRLSREARQQGTGSALALALKHVDRRAEAILVCNGDTLLTRPEGVGELAAWFAANGESRSVELCCLLQPANSLRSGFRLFRRKGLEQEIAVDQSLEQQLRGDLMCAPGTYLDIGTPEGLAAARQRFEAKEVCP